MPRDVSLSDSKCWNGGHEWVKNLDLLQMLVAAEKAHVDWNTALATSPFPEDGLATSIWAGKRRVLFVELFFFLNFLVISLFFFNIFFFMHT